MTGKTWVCGAEGKFLEILMIRQMELEVNSAGCSVCSVLDLMSSIPQAFAHSARVSQFTP